MKRVMMFLILISSFIFSQELSYIEPKRVKEVNYKVDIKDTGVIKVELKGREYIITSEFSIPEGVWARMDKDKIENIKNVKIEKEKIKGETEYFEIERSIKKHQECIEVIDKIKNKKEELLPVMMRHKVEIPDAKEHYLGGLRIYLKRGGSNEAANPTTIVITETGSIGLLPLNDVFRVHIQNFVAGNIYGIADNELVIRPKTEYTARWAIFVTEDKDYFSVVNAIRRFFDSNFTIPGSFCFFTPRTKSYLAKDAEKLKAHYNTSILATSDMDIEDMKTYFTNKNANIISFSFNKVAGGVDTQNKLLYLQQENIDYIKPIIERVRKAYPNGKISPYFHSFIDTSPDAKEKHKDAITLLPDGTQADYGQPIYPLFFPTLENSFGKELEKLIDLFLDVYGADGIYWDEFEYSRVKYHYGEPHDGYSADIDQKTYKITRLKSSITLLTQDWRVKMVEKILNEKKKLLVINGNPATETIMRYKVPRFVETGSISNCVRAQLFTPIALGDHLTERSEKDCYKKMLEALDYGCVYYWYYFLIWPEYP
ncbi:MAG: hypothetical protein NC932_00465, partial [Candidatus Omnitrophica bacterium]|nr:hypothetical protein [Candidatus Omnitrophota bacterium]